VRVEDVLGADLGRLVLGAFHPDQALGRRQLALTTSFGKAELCKVERAVLGKVVRVELRDDRPARRLRAELVAAHRVDHLLEGGDHLRRREERQQPEGDGAVRIDIMVGSRRKDEELSGLETAGLSDREDLALAFGDEHDLLGAVRVEPGVLHRLDDVVGNGARDDSRVLADREDHGEALRRVVVVPDLDEVRAWLADLFFREAVVGRLSFRSPRSSSCSTA
jgi:hypothetical protein